MPSFPTKRESILHSALSLSSGATWIPACAGMTMLSEFVARETLQTGTASVSLEQQRGHPAPIGADEVVVGERRERGDQALLRLAVVPVALCVQNVEKFFEAG